MSLLAIPSPPFLYCIIQYLQINAQVFLFKSRQIIMNQHNMIIFYPLKIA